MKDMRLFKIKYLSATNTKRSRISIKDERSQKFIIIPYNYVLDNIKTIAIDHLKKIGIKIIGYGEFDISQYILFSEDFDTDLRKGE